jgi:hypothetical protein
MVVLMRVSCRHFTILWSNAKENPGSYDIPILAKAILLGYACFISTIKRGNLHDVTGICCDTNP